MGILLICITLGAGGPALFAQEFSDYYYYLLGLNTSSNLDNAGLTTFPILNLPLGGEQQGFAGANTSTARDLSFLEANPAGSPLQTTTQLSVQTSNIIDDINLETLAFTERFTDLGIGAYFKLLHTTFGAVDAMGEQLAAASYVESVAAVNLGYTFLRNYYFSGIAVGANLKVAYRMIPGELYQQVTDLNGTDQSTFGFMGDLGVLTRFNFLKAYSSRDKNVSLGAAVLNLGPAVGGDPLPTNFRFGITYQPFRPWLIAGDLKIPINLVDPSQSESVGFGVATALQFVNFFNIKAGFYLDNGYPKIALGTHLDLSDLSFDINYSLDFASTFSIPDHLSIQANFNLGDNGRSSLASKVDAFYVDALVAMSQGEYPKVIELCTKALELDPGYIPAKDTLSTAQRSMELEQRLESIQVQTIEAAEGKQPP